MTTTQPAAPAAPPDPLVVDRLTKTYANGTHAVRGISFTVHDDEIVGLLGPNGAGKTTTLGVLTTLVRPTGGRAVVDGHDVARDPLAVRRAIGVVFQETVLDNEFSGMDNLRLHARLWRVPDAPARIAGLLDAVGLADRANDGVGTYSGGMKRRLEIARALLGRPRILVLDEPTLGLDPIVRNEMWQMIRTLRRSQHVTVLVSTHYLEEAQGVCDRVAIIDSGEIVAIDTPTRLIESLGTNILELVVDGDPTPVLGAVRGTTGLGEPMVVGSTVTAASARPAADVTDIASHLDLAGLGVTTTTVRPTSLNDVFLHLTAAPTSDRTLTPA